MTIVSFACRGGMNVATGKNRVDTALLLSELGVVRDIFELNISENIPVVSIPIHSDIDANDIRLMMRVIERYGKIRNDGKLHYSHERKICNDVREELKDGSDAERVRAAMRLARAADFLDAPRVFSDSCDFVVSVLRKYSRVEDIQTCLDIKIEERDTADLSCSPSSKVENKKKEREKEKETNNRFVDWPIDFYEKTKQIDSK